MNKIAFSLLLLVYGSLIYASTNKPVFLAQKIDGPDKQWFGPFSEGSAVFDVNNDGILDITSGAFWYEGPKFIKHPLRKVKAHGEFISNGGEYPFDMNGDGWTDLVSWGWFEDQNIYWYENTQNSGERWSKHKIADSQNTEFLLFEDVDGDGDPDLLPSLWCYHDVHWLENQNGTFVRHSIDTTKVKHGIGFGDINGDGLKDIVSTKGWYQAPNDRINGQWQFFPEFQITNDMASMPMQMFDVNGDGHEDILYGLAHDYGLYWLEQKNSSNGRTWIRHTIDSSFSQVHAIELADINNDGRLDLITGKRLRGHEGKDPGAFEPLGIYWYDIDPKTASFTKHIISYNALVGIGMKINVVDIDKDSDLDIVVSGKSGLYLLENMSVFDKKISGIIQNMSSWRFDQILLPPFHPDVDVDKPWSGEYPGPYNAQTTIVDINQDGHMDLFFDASQGASSGYKIVWYEGPNWEMHRINKGDFMGNVWIDMDKDGDQDPVIAKGMEGSSALVWLENPGGERAKQTDWVEHTIIPLEVNPNTDMIKSADVNGDGLPDIVLQSFNSRVFYIPGIQNPKSENWKYYEISGFGGTRHTRTGLSLGDVDNDGDIDAVFGNGWLENPGNEIVQKKPEILWTDHIIDLEFHRLAQSAVVDLNQDNLNDIVLICEERGHVVSGIWWYQGNDNPNDDSWERHMVLNNRERLHSIGIADFNGDGKLDIYTAQMHQNWESPRRPGYVSIFECIDLHTNLWKEHIISTVGSHLSAIGDLDNDGDPDIAGCNWNNTLAPERPMRPNIWLNKIKD